MKAILYLRVSTDEQVDGASLDVQEKSCRKKATDSGAAEISLERDEGFSARNVAAKNAPHFLSCTRLTVSPGMLPTITSSAQHWPSSACRFSPQQKT